MQGVGASEGSLCEAAWQVRFFERLQAMPWLSAACLRARDS